MPRPTRKPFWRWAPLPYLVLILLMLVTGTLEDAGATGAFRILLAVTIVVAVVLVAWFVAGLLRGPRNPDAAGVVRALEGLELVAFERTDAPPVPVVTRHRRHGVEAAHAYGGDVVRAVLVPDATTWWGLGKRVSVQLVAGERVFDGGWLNDQASVVWNPVLSGMRGEGRYAVVPAAIELAGALPAVTVDLGALRALRA